MSAPDLLGSLTATGALVLPGWFVARAVRLPQPLLAGFVGGAVAMLFLVLALDALHLPLSIGWMGGGWLSLIAVAAWKRRRAEPSRRTAPDAGAYAWSENWPLLLPLIPALAVVVYRASAQPLFGVDTVFRWNYLAEQMLARSSLGFYPPMTAADYEVYAWPDGIAPVVSTLYFWNYAIAGATRPVVTAPVVVLEFVLLIAGVHALARRMFSARAAAFAGALAACSPVMLWATAMGQETGLTAIALVALLLYLPRDRCEETNGALIFAGLAAGLGALAREYGLVLPVFGFALCLTRRLTPRAGALFLAIATLAAAPWYVRNWILTGNPLFNLGLGGWFPVNEIHAWLNSSYQSEFGWASLPTEAPRLLAVNCLAGLLGGAAGLLLYCRAARPLAVAAVLFIGLWLASLGYTAAGFIYALRVLNPALAMAAILGGAALARAIPDRRALAGAVVALSLFGTDAALRALTLPANVYRLPPGEWLKVGNALHEYHQRPIYRELARVAGTERMLVLGPNALLATHGARTVPLWSPEVRFVFDPALPAVEIARRLRAAGIGFVLLNTGAVNERFLARSAFFREPAGTLPRVWFDQDMILLRIQAPPEG